MRILVVWLINTLALLAVSYLMVSVNITTVGVAIVAAAILGLVNTFVRPILLILTLPVTLLTLGLFLFVINALMFWLVAEIVPGFKVSGFMAALLGSILYSVITLITSWLLFPRKN